MEISVKTIKVKFMSKCFSKESPFKIPPHPQTS